MLRLVLGAALAAVVMFVWGFVFWALLPIHAVMVRPVADEAALQQVLEQNLPETGSYVVPLLGHDEGSTPGTFAHIFFRRDPVNPMGGGYLLTGFVHSFLSALFAGYLLTIVVGVCHTYWRRVAFVVLIGAFANFVMHVGDIIWFQHAASYHLPALGYGVVNWFLAGLALAWLIDRPIRAR